MNITEKEYRVLVSLPDNTRVQFILAKHLEFIEEVRRQLGDDFIDKIWEKIKECPS